MPSFKIEIGCRSARYFEKRVMGLAVGIILNLHHQRWNNVEGLVNAGKFFQQLHHAVIIFQRMKTHPREMVLSGDQVFVKRLVHVP